MSERLERHKWYERHQWWAVAAHNGVGLTSIADGSQKRLITIVLYFCQCGKHKTKTLNGHWSLGQILTRDVAAKIGESK